MAKQSYFYMNVQDQIKGFIASQPEPKRSEIQQLHNLIMGVDPGCKLWFLDGKNSEGKVVSNPDIGYGSRDHKYADGTVSEFYQIGVSANKTGISIYILGIEDKKYLTETYAATLGKATVTGYCIRFKTLKDINTDVLEAAIRFGFENPNKKIEMATDWYRCKSWTKAEEEQFFAELGRARKDGRAQYLKVQAVELIAVGDSRLLPAAESLLNTILNDFPNNRLEKSQTQNLLGVISRTRGDKERALQYFKQAVNFEKDFPNVISGANLNFAETVVEEDRSELYDEVEQILLAEINNGGLTFPFEWYIMSSVLSVIYASKGDSDKAKYYADIADSNAAANANTLRNPKKRSLGLVEKRKAWLDRRVREGLRLVTKL